MKLGIALGIACFAVGSAHADTTPQPLPFAQDWTNTEQITADDDWSGVPGIVGYKDDLTGTTADVDPQTRLAPQTAMFVIANRTTGGTLPNSGVAEFHLPDPVVGLLGGGTADAPNLVIHVNTSGVAGVRVRYDVRDLDSGADNAVQQVALQYRIGNTGDFANVPAGYIADATTGGTATQVTAVNAMLPSDAGGKPLVEIRILTTNATGNDEYIGIDNIVVEEAPTPPTAVGASDPASVAAGGAVELLATVTSGTLPPSTGVVVTCDATPIGGAMQLALVDDGMNGDAMANDNIFTASTTVAAGTAAGVKMLGCTLRDDQMRPNMFSITVTVVPTCGDGRTEAPETCDDDGIAPADGCSATCTVETGYTCTASTTAPSVCSDVDECMTGADDCDVNALCTNSTGSFSCACNAGYAGDGKTCNDVDECATESDDCDANARCDNMPGTFDCTCNTGFEGDGRTCTAISACGDGVLDSEDDCDDGNAQDGDGCSSSCAVEPAFVCTGEPSVCRGDRDEDGVPNVDDSCPNVANPAQEDEDDDGIGDACDTPSEGGCCSSSRDNGAGAWLLAIATLIALRPRRVRSAG